MTDYPHPIQIHLRALHTFRKRKNAERLRLDAADEIDRLTAVKDAAKHALQEARDEIQQLRENQPLFDDLGKTISSQLDTIEKLRDIVIDAQELLMNGANPEGLDVKMWCQEASVHLEAPPVGDKQPPKLESPLGRMCTQYDENQLGHDPAADRLEHDDETRGELIQSLYEWINAGGSIDRVITAMDERYGTVSLQRQEPKKP